MKNLFDNYIPISSGNKLRVLGCYENGFNFYWDTMEKAWHPRWLYQQAADWLRENHSLHIEIVFSDKPDQFYYYIGNMTNGNMWRGSNTTYNNARIEAINKAIELISMQSK